jgi:DNA-binding NtrC family response regulator
MSGLEALSKIRSRPELTRLPVIVISGHASVAEAVEAVQMGATDFFEKPLDRDRVLVSVHNALKTSKLQREVERLREGASQRYEMIGESLVMRRLYAEVEKVAPTRGRVLITGESGTGKELIARAIHRLSPRKDAAFIKVNCAAIPGELIESELFGYEKGAFTGAVGRKKGLFEQANGGTLFLDEIGDMSLDAQAKVLRALQSGEITRVGSEQTVIVDVRVVAATNRDLQAAVASNTFREDLYFRLNVVPLRAPPLRDRADDVPMLSRSFVELACRENGMKVKPISEEALTMLAAYPWPGNVRELRIVIERLVILSEDSIDVGDLPEEIVAEVARRRREEATTATELPRVELPAEARALPLREFRDHMEREYIRSKLDENGWNISRTATLLGIERTNLHKKMRALGLSRDNQGQGPGAGAGQVP